MLARKDIIMLSHEELRRLHVIKKVIGKQLKQGEGASLLGVSARQIRRQVKRVKEEGDGGIAHRSRGKASNRQLPVELRERAIELYRSEYKGFGPTMAAEKLLERNNVDISDETLRLWLIETGDWEVKRRKKQYRQWRQRKGHYGEMLQIDGSHHDWFEGRRPKSVLMGYIDDATGKTHGRFYEYEGTMPALDSMKRYIKKNGIPMSVYLDKHTTYRSPRSSSAWNGKEGEESLSQFERAMKEMGVKVIHAHSPQAKGRIERLFKTFQDRLVKEMRLAGIQTIEQGNAFLSRYLPIYNRRFAVKAAEKENFHLSVRKGLNLETILCKKMERTLRNDFTVAYKGVLYQVTETTDARKVMVEEKINGSVHITYKGSRLQFKKITERPQKQQKKNCTVRRKSLYIPPATHPWRHINLKNPLRKSAS